jgi:hypothetical protein
MARFRGLSECKGNCSGHRAGYRYAQGGGTMPSRRSSSFNNGMRIALGTFRAPPAAPRRKKK